MGGKKTRVFIFAVSCFLVVLAWTEAQADFTKVWTSFKMTQYNPTEAISVEATVAITPTSI